jgi:hypothetical protein
MKGNEIGLVSRSCFARHIHGVRRRIRGGAQHANRELERLVKPSALNVMIQGLVRDLQSV